MMNNIFVGQTTPTPGTNYTWNGFTYSGCSTTPITASDYQQALWVLVGSTAGATCNQPGGLGTQCGTGLQTLNPCNVAFILDSAFAAVPKGCVPALEVAACLRTYASALFITLLQEQLHGSKQHLRRRVAPRSDRD